MFTNIARLLSAECVTKSPKNKTTRTLKTLYGRCFIYWGALPWQLIHNLMLMNLGINSWTWIIDVRFSYFCILMKMHSCFFCSNHNGKWALKHSEIYQTKLTWQLNHKIRNSMISLVDIVYPYKMYFSAFV